MTVRVLVVDDQELMRSGFSLIIDSQEDMEVVGEAENGVRALELVRELSPDVVLLDIRMPELDGIEVLKRLADRPDTRAIMLTTFDDDDFVYRSLEAGAAGFLLKDARRDDLSHAVRVVAAGEALLAPSVTRRLVTDAVTRRARRGNTRALPELTSREREMLVLIARGLSNTEIAEAEHVSAHTVKTHVSKLLFKLGLRDRTQAVIAAYESGLVVPGGPAGT
ncbi:response regulator [Haloglycomyces albus]|uniref:response regulator n=1 Tax=Haloglycomyces albus TaxID=526067 RepID=UPI00046D1021|nr:response regulator transcription factor [Haloglycomyces albus]